MILHVVPGSSKKLIGLKQFSLFCVFLIAFEIILIFLYIFSIFMISAARGLRRRARWLTARDCEGAAGARECEGPIFVFSIDFNCFN